MCLYFNLDLSIWGNYLCFPCSKSIFTVTVPTVCFDYRTLGDQFSDQNICEKRKDMGAGNHCASRLKVLTSKSLSQATDVTEYDLYVVQSGGSDGCFTCVITVVHFVVSLLSFKVKQQSKNTC